MSESKLTACPFCGGRPVVWQIEKVEDWRVGCAHESCQMYRVTTLHKPTKAEAIAAWNRRYVCDDKNGDPVFVGDEVKISSEKGVVYEVVYDDDVAAFALHDWEASSHTFFYELHSDEQIELVQEGGQ